jgi:hypothetical protein
MSKQNDKELQDVQIEGMPQTISQEQLFAKMMDFWLEAAKLPTIGPLYAFSKDASSSTQELFNLSKTLLESKANADQYWVLINSTFAKAYKQTLENSPKKFSSKQDFETYRKVMIEAFEQTFTELFDSKEFAIVYGKLFSNQLDILKSLQGMAERSVKVLNLPTRSEVDEILRDIHDLKKSVRDLKGRLEEVNARNESTGQIAT